MLLSFLTNPKRHNIATFLCNSWSQPLAFYPVSSHEVILQHLRKMFSMLILIVQVGFEIDNNLRFGHVMPTSEHHLTSSVIRES